jgi:calcineurin-like phosphoesterase
MYNKTNLKVLIFWDIYWRVWRKALKKEIEKLKEKFNPDFIIANWENLASWRWPTEKLILEMWALWIDLFTWWNHSFDNEKKLINYIEKEESILIRPANHLESRFYKIPWKGYKIIEKNWKKLLVINLMSSLFMKDEMSNVFLKLDEIIEKFKNTELNWIIVDFHRETSSEIFALSFFAEKLSKQISLIYWTHTHVQTNDEIILPSWIWLINDIWMTWSLYSVIWANYKSLEKRFLTWISKWKIEQDLWKDYVVNYLFVEIDEKTGKAIHIEKDRIRNKL